MNGASPLKLNQGANADIKIIKILYGNIEFWIEIFMVQVYIFV